MKLRTEWLARHLAGKRVDRILSERSNLTSIANQLSGCPIEQCSCKGKHIFISFEGGYQLHNHLLMHGKWRRTSGPFLFPPVGVWLVIEVGAQAICNINGQVLEWLDAQQAEAVKSGLGPDILDEPYPVESIAAQLRTSSKPVSEAIMDQAIVCGIGNVAKSESLYRARIDPRTPANRLSDAGLEKLIEAMRWIMMESYMQGGRWTHRVYHRAGQSCPTCGGKIATIRMPPTKRTTFFCPRCQQLGDR